LRSGGCSIVSGGRFRGGPVKKLLLLLVLVALGALVAQKVRNA
jgi:hypothetical protein